MVYFEKEFDLKGPEMQLAILFLRARLERIEEAVIRISLDETLSADGKLAAKWGREFYLAAVRALMTCDLDEMKWALSQALKAVAILTVWWPEDEGGDARLAKAITEYRAGFNVALKGIAP